MNSEYYQNSATGWPTKHLLLLFFGILVVTIGGCSSRQLVSTEPEIKPVSEIHQWQIKARVAIRSEKESVAATLEWRKQERDFDFHLFGLFGATYAHLTQKGPLATLKVPDEETFYHYDAEQLLYEALGWDFPVDALSYWVKGLPSNKPGESVSRNQKGQLTNITYNDWKIDFSRFQKYSGYIMPRKITATHPQLTLRIVVKKWNFAPVENS